MTLERLGHPLEILCICGVMELSSDTHQLDTRFPILSVPGVISVTFLSLILLGSLPGLSFLLIKCSVRHSSRGIDVHAASYNVVCTGITSNDELHFICIAVVNDVP